MTTKFQVGKTYFDRSACDYDCIFTMTVTARTEKTITATVRDQSKTLRNAKTGKHSPLKVAIADHRALSNPGGGGFRYRTLSVEFFTLPEAKTAAKRFLTENPHFLER